MNENMQENMQENTEETVEETVQGNENSPSLSETIIEDLTNGLHSPLFCSINDVTIRDVRIRDAFTRFLKEVECGDSITVMDVLDASENCAKSSNVDVNAGNAIYTYNADAVQDSKLRAKLLKYSVFNLYSLFSVHNGIALELGLLGGTVASAESKHYLIIPPKKEEKIINDAKRKGVELIKVGEVISSNKILLSLNNDVVAAIEKSDLNKASQKIDVGTEHFNAFLAGYNAVCSLALCNCVSSNNIIRFGLGGTLSEVFARTLGFFSALSYLKTIPVKVVFVSDNNATVAVSRPTVADGDYLYLLKVRKDAYELPDKGHFGQLYYYLTEKKRTGIIKDVLPCGENINRVIKRLCTDTLVYDKLTDMPDNCFGVVVTVGRGESVNGIRIGYFKNN